MPKISKFGNVSVPKAKGSISNKVVSSDFPTYVPKPPPVNDFFSTSTVQSSATDFDVSTGFTSDKPEILSLIDFLPIYEDNAILTKFGEFLQSKQDSKLISAKASIDSFLSLGDFNKIEEKIKDNRKKIKDFFFSYGTDIESLLFEIEALKSKMDFRFPLDQKVLEDAGYSQYYTFGKPLDIEQILDESKSVVESWTPTKSWLQSCIKIKDLLREGMPYSLSDTNFISDVDGYKDPYTIVSPLLMNSRLSYNYLFSGVGKVVDIYGGDIYNLGLPPVQGQTIPASLDFENLSDVIETVASLKVLLSKQFGLFTNEPFSSSDTIENCIAKLSFLISKEFRYSMKLVEGNQANTKASQIFSSLGYSLNLGGSNKDFWNFAIGLFGKDITDIQISPPGNGNSFVSLSQTIETNNVEVLTFEDQYLKDDIGNRKGTTLTPGTFYYLESALNSSATGFDTARIDSLIGRLGSSIDLCNFLTDEMMFDDSVLPFKTVGERINGVYSNNKKDSNITTVFDLLYGTPEPVTVEGGFDNPLSLIRKIENSVLSNSQLLNREVGPPVPGSQDYFDFSGPLITAALGDSELLCLLFLMIRIDSLGIQGSSISKDKLVSQLETRIKQIFTLKDLSLVEIGPFGPKINFINIKLQDFFNPLDQASTNNFHPFHVLKKIGLLLQDSKNSLSGGAFLPNQLTDEGLIAYSGINSTSYLFSLFYLCCLIIHSANSDNITGLVASNSFEEEALPLSIERIKDPFFLQTSGVSNLFQGIGNAGSEPEKILVVDNVLQSAENVLFSYIRKSMSKLNAFKIFLSTLRTRLNNFRTQLISGKFKKFLDKTRQYLKNPDDIRRLMTREQLRLVQALGKDFDERCREDYESPVKKIYPYFDSLKDNKSIDSLLPIEDASLVSWNLFLKNQLKFPKFRDTEGFNIKIVSVGIPQQLIRRLQTNASEVSQASQKNKIVKINLYRIDALRPYLIHKPQTFLFDLNRFPTKNLENFPTAIDVLNGKKQLSSLPFLRQNNVGQIEVFDPLSSEFAFLSPLDRQNIDNNHTFSYVMEEYFRFISGLSISEMKFNEFAQISKIDSSQFDSFMQSAIGRVPDDSLNPSCKKFFINNTFALSSINTFITKSITPRKFDRIFYIPFDPDDFKIDKHVLLNLDHYIDEGTVVEMPDGTYKRARTSKNQVTFDRYFVSLETFTLNTVASSNVINIA